MVYPTLWRTSAPAWEDAFGTRRELDRVLDRFFSGSPTVAAAWTPVVDVRESEDALTVVAELPGIAREDVAVSVENSVLSISGEKQQESKNEKDEWHLVERRYGRFERSFTLPRTVDAGRISAEFVDGVLTITLPKAEEAKPRRIDVKVG